MKQENTKPLPQHKFHKPPSFPGTASFHLGSGMTQRPERESTPTWRSWRASKSCTLSTSSRIKPAIETTSSQSMSNSPDFRPGQYDTVQLTPQSMHTPQDSPSDLNTNIWSDVAVPASTVPPKTPFTIPPEGFQLADEYPIPSDKPDITLSFNGILDNVGAQFESLGLTEAALDFQLEDYRQTPNDTQDDMKWNKILLTNRSLLEQYHDFFIVSESEDAPEGLRYLAARYGMPTRMWAKGFQETLEVLRQRLPRAEPKMEAMIHLASSSLARLRLDLPHMQMHWDLIEWNLCEYFIALQKDGTELGIPLNYILQCLGSNSTDFPQMRFHQRQQEETVYHDPSFAWYFEENLRAVLQSCGLGLKTSLAKVRICEAAQLLMGGWLYYGRTVPGNTFQSFVQVFIFLGLLGADVFRSSGWAGQR